MHVYAVLPLRANSPAEHLVHPAVTRFRFSPFSHALHSAAPQSVSYVVSVKIDSGEGLRGGSKGVASGFWC